MVSAPRVISALAFFLLLFVGTLSLRVSSAGPNPSVPPGGAGPSTLEQLLSVPSSSDLVAAPSGRAVAWVFNERGRRNVWVAEGAALQARALTSFGADDGVGLRNLAWTPDGRAVVFVRGNTNGAGGEPLNPASEVGTVFTRSIWMARLDGGSPRLLGTGHSPAVSPRGDLVAFIHEDKIWTAPLREAGSSRRPFHTPGRFSGLAWSPDGVSLAFATTRGPVELIGVFHGNRPSIEYVSPGVDRDSYPRWSPDGRHLAFFRSVNVESRSQSSARVGPLDAPWALMVATRATSDADFGPAVEVFRSPVTTLGSFSRNLQFLDWVDGNRLVFASEHEDWAHLYLVDPARPGSAAALLTPGACEVDQVALATDRRAVFVASNCGDLERRHLWKVTLPPKQAAGDPPSPERLMPGTGVETTPTPLADGQTLVCLKGGAGAPMLPSALSLATGGVVPMAAGVIPASFARQRFVEPTLAVFKAADGLELHATVFEPPAEPKAVLVRRPALIHIHGGPRAGQELLGWQPVYQHFASRGYVILGLNYRRGAGYGRPFREAPHGYAEGASEYQDILAAAEYLRSRPDVDPARLGIWGMSYGGYLTQLALARNSDLFAAGVTECGIFDISQYSNAPLARASSAAGSIDTWKSPVLIIYGGDDGNGDANAQAVALVKALRARHVPFEQLVFPDEGHGSSVWAHALRAHQATADFFDRKLGGKNNRRE